ncbi:DMT family transporter [Pseudonocardia sp. ICBG162]|uniref:DMT family transporter n=1 Tax=Pseudonocardia sp. ICBG162 TaxID=2846761 RepID=UPI001CF65297|nr:DMT family transporter [Pseudonocardia sp. ICBG162]
MTTVGRTAPGTVRATAALSAGFVLMWSSGFIGGRLSGHNVPVVTVMLWRFAVVSLVLAAAVWFVRSVRRRRPDGPPPRQLEWREIRAQAVVGLLGQAVFIWANVGAVVAGVGAGTAALVAALQPIVAGAAAGLVLGERVGPRQWLGLTLGLLGVIIVVGTELGSGTTPGWAYALPLAGMLALVAASLVERTTSAGGTPLLEALTIQSAASAAVFAAPALIGAELLPPPGSLGIFTVVLAWFIGFGTVGAYGFYWLLLRRSGLTRLSSLIYLTPPTTALWAWLMFGDPIESTLIGGMTVCAVAVVLVHTTRHSLPTHRPARRARWVRLRSQRFARRRSPTS